MIVLSFLTVVLMVLGPEHLCIALNIVFSLMLSQGLCVY